MTSLSLRRLLLADAAATGMVAAAVLMMGPSPERPVPIPASQPMPQSDDLSAGLRRCAALGGTEAKAAGCAKVWEENRRRFFGGEVQRFVPAGEPASPDAQVPMPRPVAPREGTAR